ncbi:hypothetical protein SAMN04488065_0785 [Haloplanus vescus]|uniref:Uncharacterized protein n=1 Tax=Haloplanus vescus TaxID=555874 RepID=A0A1H3WDS5_9EURY|nr:hypothetical protein [Haloplanus vescus]SDZ85253.1 hypothetical protein SAMN04488065_0785 [Haloplanus vescus]
MALGSIADWLVTLGRTLALWGGALLLLASTLSFYQGWGRWRRSSVVDETPQSDIGALDAPGVVHVRGEIVTQTPHDTFHSPIGDDERTVLSAWEIEERYDKIGNESWEKSAWGVRSTPFSLSDGTGRIRVDLDDIVVGNETDDVFTPETLLTSTGVSVDGLRCEFESFDVRVRTGYDESPPPRIADFLERTDGISVGPMTTALGRINVDDSERRYREQTLQLGDEVSIVGRAIPHGTDSPARHADDVVLTQTDETTVYLSVPPLDEATDIGGPLLFGVFTGLVGIALLAIRAVI